MRFGGVYSGRSMSLYQELVARTTKGVPRVPPTTERRMGRGLKRRLGRGEAEREVEVGEGEGGRKGERERGGEGCGALMDRVSEALS